MLMKCNPVDNICTLAGCGILCLDTKLPYIELAINTTANVSTGQKSFIPVYRSKARLLIDLTLGNLADIVS